MGGGTVADVDGVRNRSEPTVVYPPRGRLLVLVATCGFFAGMSFVVAGSGNQTLTAVGGFGLVAFGLAATMLLGRALRPGPTVTLDAEGITDRTTLSPTGLVRWEEVAAVRKREIGRGVGAERVLEIVLVDPERLRHRPRSPTRRLLDRYRALLKQPYVTIPGSMVSMPLGTLVEQMHLWRPELPVLELPVPPPKLLRRWPLGTKHPSLPPW